MIIAWHILYFLIVSQRQKLTKHGNLFVANETKQFTISNNMLLTNAEYTVLIIRVARITGFSWTLICFIVDFRGRHDLTRTWVGALFFSIKT